MSEPPALYNPTVMDHFLNPRNVGELAQPDAVGEAGEPNCGDMLKLHLRIAGGRIADVRFRALGCAAAIASSSMATELIKGRTLEEARHFSNDEVVAALGGLPEGKMQCSVLAAEALRAALREHDGRAGGATGDSRNNK